MLGKLAEIVTPNVLTSVDSFTINLKTAEKLTVLIIQLPPLRNNTRAAIFKPSPYLPLEFSVLLESPIISKFAVSGVKSLENITFS